MKINSQHIYSLLGIYFALLGILTLINVAAGYHEAGVILWHASIYTAMNFLMAYGLYTREKWILPAVALNAIGMIVLGVGVIVRHGFEGAAVSSGVAIILTLLIFLYINKTKKMLSLSKTGVYTGSVFIILWLVAYVYTMLQALT